MTEASAIRTATTEESDRVFDTLTVAFASDPFARWLWPDPQTFLVAWKRLLTPYGGQAFTEGSAWIAGDHQAAALWLPPGVESDGDAMTAIVMETVASDRLEEIGTLMAMIEDAHPEGDLWYLPVIGCDPAFVGKGLGGALMRQALDRVDESGMPAYLESSNPRNISLYLRHGFEVIGEIQVGGSPVMTPMLRAAR